MSHSNKWIKQERDSMIVKPRMTEETRQKLLAWRNELIRAQVVGA